MKKAVFLLAYVVPLCYAANDFVLFKKIPLSKGHQCAINDLLFTRSFDAFNRCLFECSTHQMCKQCFYEQNQTNCMGCSSLEMQLAPNFKVTESYVIDECEASDSPGVNGETCTEDHSVSSEGTTDEPGITECGNRQCQHGGICVDSVDTTHSCKCVAGYEGTNCETDIDECASNPCQYGGTCTDAVDSYSCTCVGGYRGNNCETDSDLD